MPDQQPPNNGGIEEREDQQISFFMNYNGGDKEGRTDQKSKKVMNIGFVVVVEWESNVVQFCDGRCSVRNIVVVAGIMRFAAFVIGVGSVGTGFARAAIEDSAMTMVAVTLVVILDIVVALWNIHTLVIGVFYVARGLRLNVVKFFVIDGVGALLWTTVRHSSQILGSLSECAVSVRMLKNELRGEAGAFERGRDIRGKMDKETNGNGT